ncbi:MAG: UDP-N-acetylmuramate dehydrogenase [Ignavibacteriales bacterium]|nr:UDP-N-acetylmuramate dehydrogenase [Ignavibacteriales bacterium]
MVSLKDIQTFFRGRLTIHEPLAPYTSMKVGGPADYYLEPADKDDVVGIVRYLEENKFPFMMVGRGSNLIISDEGYRGAAINLEEGISRVTLEEGLIVAEGGARLTKLVDFCVQSSLSGLEWAAGIPGTVGGAVVMNAGAHGGEIKDSLVDVEVYRGGSVLRIEKEKADLSYRRSGFTADIVLSARFNLQPGNRDEIMKRRSELIAKRNATQPLNLPNSGSMFKNPPGTFAARLIEQAGLKGKRVGNVQISEKHANFMVNLGNARAEDILRLIELVRRTVHQNTGIQLDLEVKLIGFPQNSVAHAS